MDALKTITINRYLMMKKTVLIIVSILLTAGLLNVQAQKIGEIKGKSEKSGNRRGSSSSGSGCGGADAGCASNFLGSDSC